jgi:hypothetical protein
VFGDDTNGTLHHKLAETLRDKFKNERFSEEEMRSETSSSALKGILEFNPSVNLVKGPIPKLVILVDHSLFYPSNGEKTRAVEALRAAIGRGTRLFLLDGTIEHAPTDLECQQAFKEFTQKLSGGTDWPIGSTVNDDPRGQLLLRSNEAVVETSLSWLSSPVDSPKTLNLLGTRGLAANTLLTCEADGTDCGVALACVGYGEGQSGYICYWADATDDPWASSRTFRQLVFGSLYEQGRIQHSKEDSTHQLYKDLELNW